MNGLGEDFEVVSLASGLLYQSFYGWLAGKQENVAARCFLPKVEREFDPIHLGKHYIHDGEFRRPFRYDARGVFSRICEANIVSVRGENLRECVGDDLLIFDNQYTSLSHVCNHKQNPHGEKAHNPPLQ